MIPLRHEVRHAADGRIADADGLGRDAGAGRPAAVAGRLRRRGRRPAGHLAGRPGGARRRPRLVAGNPPRSLDDTVRPRRRTASASPSATRRPERRPPPRSRPSRRTRGGAGGAPQNAATEPGAAWLDRLREALDGRRGARPAVRRPRRRRRRRARPRDVRAGAPAQRRAMLSRGASTPQPAVASPSGYLDPAALRLIDRRPRPCWSPTGCSAAPAPAAGARSPDDTARRHLLGRGSGRPRPRRPAGRLVALRQRILSEAARPAARPGPPPAGRRAAPRLGPRAAPPGSSPGSTSTGSTSPTLDAVTTRARRARRPTTSSTTPRARSAASSTPRTSRPPTRLIAVGETLAERADPQRRGRRRGR